MNLTSNFQRSALALGLLVAAILFVGLVIALPILNGFSQRQDQRQMLLASIQRNQRVVASLPIYSRVALEQKKSASRFSILAASPADASERLRQRVMKLVSETGGSLTNVEESDTTDSEITVRADLKLTYTQLYEILSRLQTEEPHVSVRYLSVTADRALETGHLDQMDARFDLSAQWRLGQAGDASLDTLDPGFGAGGPVGRPDGGSREN
jgi:biopolymer transport protein ExbD